MTEHWSSLDIDLTRWWGHYLCSLWDSHVSASRKDPDEIPAATQTISKRDYQQKAFWMGIEADLESKNLGQIMKLKYFILRISH